MRVNTEKYWYDIVEFDGNVKMNHFYIQEIEDNQANTIRYILRKIVNNYSFNNLYDYVNDYDYYPVGPDMIYLRYYKIIDSNNHILFQKRNRKRKFNRIIDENNNKR